jgi:hypothetical protein
VPEAVTVKGSSAPTRRGAGDAVIRRDQLEAAPHQRASEMLSAAPGFFVDHEDGEGLGNDVHLRGFDLEHGSGVEFRVQGVPINAPVHLLGQGYADVDFVIPEVVRAIRVQQGVFDPRQGNAAIAGTVDFDLGVAQRGALVKTTYGSFHQMRAMGLIAPPGEAEGTFAAVALRRSDGFGQSRASSSATGNGSWSTELGDGVRLRLIGAVTMAGSDLAGVVRQDDVDAGRVGMFDRYPSPFAGGQSTKSSRGLAAAIVDRTAPSGTRVEGTVWAMRTGLRLRQNYTGNVQTSDANPAIGGLGDLIETNDAETAVGAGARVVVPLLATQAFEVRVEPGLSLRTGFTDQSRSLLTPGLVPWDRRVDAFVRTVDAGGYVDVDVRIARKIRLAGGVRGDVLTVSVDDRLQDERRRAMGVPLSPRVSLGVDATSWLYPSISWGQGFRTLDAHGLRDGDTHPYSKVTSTEIGARASMGERYSATLAFYETRVGNELVFDASSGGLETEGASVRRGMTASVLGRPVDGGLVSAAFSVNRATYQSADEGSRFVPSVPAFLFRTDASLRGTIGHLEGRPLGARAGVGFTLLGPKHLDDRTTTTIHRLIDASAGLRFRAVEVSIDVHNLLDQRYPDDEQVFASSWNGAPPTVAKHVSAAPPRTILGTVAVSVW